MAGNHDRVDRVRSDHTERVTEDLRADAGRNVVCASHIQICDGADLLTANRCRQHPGMLRAHYSGADDADPKRHRITLQADPSAATPRTRHTRTDPSWVMTPR